MVCVCKSSAGPCVLIRTLLLVLEANCYVPAQTCTCAHTHTRAHTHARTHTHTLTHARAHAHTHTHTHTRIHTVGLTYRLQWSTHRTVWTNANLPMRNNFS